MQLTGAETVRKERLVDGSELCLRGKTISCQNWPNYHFRVSRKNKGPAPEIRMVDQIHISFNI